MKAIDKLRKHPRVEFVDDERNLGNGVIVTLKAGWHFDPTDVHNRVRGEDTVTAILQEVRNSQKVPDGVAQDD